MCFHPLLCVLDPSFTFAMIKNQNDYYIPQQQVCKPGNLQRYINNRDKNDLDMYLFTLRVYTESIIGTLLKKNSSDTKVLFVIFKQK